MWWIPPYPDNPASRFFRVLLSVIVSALAALIISLNLWDHIDGHYTHRAAAPLFVFFFVFPFFVGFITVATIVLYWLDRLAFRYKPLSKSQSIVLLLLLATGALTGYYESLIGGFFVFLLIYWLMTGRVAGRQGWSARDFRQTKWDEKLYIVASALVFGPVLATVISSVLYSVLPIIPTTEPLPYRAKYAHHWDNDLRRAVQRFPDAQACLEKGAQADHRKDLFRMDWDKIRTTGDAEVCSYRLLHALGGIENATSWLEAQGYRVGKNFSSASPFVERDGTLRVTGGWSIRKNGPRFPTSGVVRRIVDAVPYGMGVNVTYSADGQELLYLHIDFSTL